MANYDQSGNPLGDRNPTQQGGQQRGGQGGYASGQSGSRPGGQQSQYAGSQDPTQGRSMQQPAGRAPAAYGGSYPDLYSQFGAGPFALISRLSDEMDRLFDGFGFGTGAPSGRGQRGLPSQPGEPSGMRTLWAPHIEVAEREGKLLIQADLPGVRKEDVNVQIEDDAVILQGQRRQETERNERGFYHSERSYGSFYRLIPLPEGVDAAQADASFRDGVLRIEVPVPQQRSRGRRLEIRDESEQHRQAGQGGAPGAGSTPYAGGTQTQHGASPTGVPGQQSAGSPAASGPQGSAERR